MGKRTSGPAAGMIKVEPEVRNQLLRRFEKAVEDGNAEERLLSAIALREAGLIDFDENLIPWCWERLVATTQAGIDQNRAAIHAVLVILHQGGRRYSVIARVQMPERVCEAINKWLFPAATQIDGRPNVEMMLHQLTVLWAKKPPVKEPLEGQAARLPRTAQARV